MGFWNRMWTGEQTRNTAHRDGGSAAPRRQGHQHIHQSRWTQGDQDQNNHKLPHCCGVCQDSPIGDVRQGLM